VEGSRLVQIASQGSSVSESIIFLPWARRCRESVPEAHIRAAGRWVFVDCKQQMFICCLLY